MPSRSIQSLLLLLLIAAMIPSCKSPISPTPAGPALTLTIPDSAHVFDTVPFLAHYPDSIKPTWDYAWQFGDSAKASTHDTAISHTYDSVGTYAINVALTDTSLHQTIAKQTGQIKILPFNGPTLTLTVPDTNFWGDSCVMSVSSSQPLKPGWKFSWSLGDSTTISGVDSVLHYYLTPGNYKVTVSLNDTVHHILLASKSAIVPVVARHFNLALLQSMPYVTVTWNATVIEQFPCLLCGGSWGGSAKPLAWNGTIFTMDTTYKFNSSSGLDFDSGGGGNSTNGNIDSSFTKLIAFSSDTNGYLNSGETDGGSWCYSTSTSSLTIADVPFKQESDSDIVFEACRKFISNASYNYSSSSNGRFAGNCSLNWSAIWTDTAVTPSVIIRFHK
jgi:hypothetical protein